MQTDKMTKEQFKAQAEAFIDSYSLAQLADLLADICSEKAQHVQEAWQDESLAQQWDDAAKVLYTDSIVSLKDL